MQRFFISVLICLLVASNPANALGTKKDYKQTLLDEALNAQNKQDYKSALSSYQKAFYFYPQDKKIMEFYAEFCEGRKHFKTAKELYQNLYTLTNEKKYLLKSNLCETNSQIEFAKLHMTNHDYQTANDILEHLYKNKETNNNQITLIYIDCLIAQKQIYAAYKIISENHLEETKEGYTVLGDLNFKNKKYDAAAKNYFKALNLSPDNYTLKTRLAGSYRMLGFTKAASRLYNEALDNYMEDLDSKLGLGSLELDKMNYKKAHEIFEDILAKHPDNQPAKIGIANSYILNKERLSALDFLEKITQDDEIKFLKAQVYYDLNMPSDSKDIINSIPKNKNSEELAYKIKSDNAVTITPQYSYLVQKLSDQFKLDYQKFGLNISKNINDNSKLFIEYNNINYKSGTTDLNNVVNEFRGGIQSRPRTKIEYRADIGVKAFQFGGGMINSDSWIKYYFNDKFNLKLGYKRNNIEQSYLSAVGKYIDNIFTGRCADNKFYLEYNANLPKQFYAYGGGSYGVISSQNLTTNQYLEGTVAFGKQLYNNTRNEWLNKVSFDVISYNSAYQYNQLNLYNAAGTLFGGYFSPSYFNATTGNLKLEGNIKKWHLKWGITGFGGVQNSTGPSSTTPTWGFAPYISYEINDFVTINAFYNEYNYADVKRDQFIVNAVIKLFKKHTK